MDRPTDSHRTNYINFDVFILKGGDERCFVNGMQNLKVYVVRGIALNVLTFALMKISKMNVNFTKEKVRSDDR